MFSDFTRLSGWWWLVFFAVLGWSAWEPHDYPTWWLEVAPALLAAAVLFFTRRRFPLTPMLYLLILLHSIILMVGGHYTYAEVPLGQWWMDWFGFERNNYDKLGHLAQGFVPALVARELFVRLHIVHGHRWQGFLAVCVALAISAFYELIEWWVALFSGQAAEAFLGTQGYVWDTQSDMFMALIGASVAVWALGRLQDRQISRLTQA